MQPDNKEYTFEYKEEYFSFFSTLVPGGSYPVMGQLTLCIEKQLIFT